MGGRSEGGTRGVKRIKRPGVRLVWSSVQALVLLLVGVEELATRPGPDLVQGNCYW